MSCVRTFRSEQKRQSGFIVRTKTRRVKRPDFVLIFCDLLCMIEHNMHNRQHQYKQLAKLFTLQAMQHELDDEEAEAQHALLLSLYYTKKSQSVLSSKSKRGQYQIPKWERERQVIGVEATNQGLLDRVIFPANVRVETL